MDLLQKNRIVGDTKRGNPATPCAVIVFRELVIWNTPHFPTIGLRKSPGRLEIEKKEVIWGGI